MKVEVKNNNLIITVPMENKPFKPSETLKTLRVASTNGNQKTGLTIDDAELFVGVNAYIKNPEFKKGK